MLSASLASPETGLSLTSFEVSFSGVAVGNQTS